MKSSKSRKQEYVSSEPLDATGVRIESSLYFFFPLLIRTKPEVGIGVVNNLQPVQINPVKVLQPKPNKLYHGFDKKISLIKINVGLD